MTGSAIPANLNAARTYTARTERRVYLKTILALAVLLRLGVIWMVIASFPRNWLFSSAPDLGFLAEALVTGHGFSSPFGGSTGPTALVTPGYPAVVAVIFRIFGSYTVTSAVAVMVLQMLFTVLTIAAMVHIASRLFGAGTANLAGFVWAVSLPLLWMPAIFWETCLSALFLTGMIALALHSVEMPGKAMWILIGAYCGLTMWVNPSLILAMLAIAVWAAWRTRSNCGYAPWVGLLIALVVIAPWPIRNAYALHAFIPLRSSFGYELWQGNRAGETGVFESDLYPANSKREFAVYASEGELAYMRDKSTLAEAYIRAHPGEFIRLTGKRVLRFWIGTGGQEDSGLVELHAATTSLLGWLGLVALFKRRRTTAMLFLPALLLYPLPYYITDVKARYRLTLDPLLTILAAYAVIQLVARLNRRHKSQLSTASSK